MQNFSLVILLFLLGCQNDVQEHERQVTERELPIIYEIQNNGKTITFYSDVYRYTMLDYDFYVQVTNNLTNWAMVFCELNEQNYHCKTDAIILKRSNSQDSIYQNFNSNIFKLQSYIQKSAYFNQDNKLKNKLNALQYIVRQIIYHSEQTRNSFYNFMTYADCKQFKEIKLINEEEKTNIIDLTFRSEHTKKDYSLTLIINNGCITNLLVK